MGGQDLRYDNTEDIKDAKPIKAYKVGRLWSDPVHETMSNLAIRKVFPGLDDEEYKQFLRGVVWNDFPSNGGYLGSTPKSTFGLVLDVLAHDMFGVKTLGNDSHYGDKQIWHSMAPVGTWTNAQVLEKIIDQAREWYNSALANGRGAYAFGQLGKLSHILQDAYSGSHVDRDKELQVKGFQSYDQQSGHAHGNADKVGEYGSWDKIPGAEGAYGATLALLWIFKNKVPFDEVGGVADLIRNHVYKFAPGAGEQTAGGTRPEYTKTPNLDVPPTIFYRPIKRK